MENLARRQCSQLPTCFFSGIPQKKYGTLKKSGNKSCSFKRNLESSEKKHIFLWTGPYAGFHDLGFLPAALMWLRASGHSSQPYSRRILLGELLGAMILPQENLRQMSPKQPKEAVFLLNFLQPNPLKSPHGFWVNGT